VSWTRSFSEIDKQNEELIHGLLEDAAAGKLPGDDAKKLGDFYASCMDEPAIEALGATPLKPLLADVAKAKNPRRRRTRRR
jgi:putative endopeptidase